MASFEFFDVSIFQETLQYLVLKLEDCARVPLPKTRILNGSAHLMYTRIRGGQTRSDKFTHNDIFSILYVIDIFIKKII